jgi:hypothetical protein
MQQNEIAAFVIKANSIVCLVLFVFVQFNGFSGNFFPLLF